MKKLVLIMMCILIAGVQLVNAQVKSISGTVTSAEDGTPVPGVSVVVKGTTIGTVTNMEGNFQLQVPQDANTLMFSFVGMKTVEAPITGNTVNVEMNADFIGVDEVMVVAYGTVKKESFTGSASVVEAEKLEKMQTSSITKTLQGLSAGVQVTSGSGQPGANAEIRIRGISTFGDEGGPLIVLDGFPFDGNLNTIPTDDVASMTILKDASATALYGSRAANGVIMITTKQGREGTSILELEASYGLSDRAIKEYERVDVPTYYELQWEGIRNALLATMTPEAAAIKASQDLVTTLGGYNAYDVPNNQVVGVDGKINPAARLLYTDNWQEELFVTGKRQEITLNASGGNDKTNYYLSGTLLDDEGIIKASNFTRYSVRANVNSQIKDWIKVGMNLSGSLSDQNFPNSSGGAYANSFFYTRVVAPIYPVYLYDLQGKLQTDAEGNALFDYGNSYGRARAFSANTNPVGTVTLDTRMYKRDLFSVRTYAELTIADGFTFRPTISADYYNYTGLTHQNQEFGDAQSFQGRSTRDAERTLSYTANQLFYYDKEFGDHHINVLAGHENYANKYNDMFAVRTGFPFPGLVELDAAATAEGSGSFEDNYRIESYLSRLDYDFRDRYYLSFNFRTDGNSRFGKKVRWGNFWGAGASWRLSEEAFMQGINWINTLRLKASYGEQGNDKIGSLYAYQGLYETGWNNIDFPGLIASRLPTPELTWESLESTNIGLEAKMFDRLSLNFEYYIRNNKDLLMEKPLPPSTGFTSIDANVANLQNKGFEIELSAMLVNSTNFDWNLDLNASHYTNVIKELPQEFIVNGSKRWEVGRSIYDFWIQEFAGVNPANGKEMWYVDILDDEGEPTGERETTEVHSEADRYYVGSAIPDLIGGVTNSFRFYNFDLFVFVNYALGGKVLDGSYQALMHGGEYGDHWHKDILNRWTPQNKNTNVPIIDGDTQNTSQRSDRFLTDGSYLNIRSVNLGYTLPQSLTSRINLKSLRLYVAGDNLYMYTKRQGLDPQQSLAGVPDNQYVPVRTVSFGLNVKF